MKTKLSRRFVTKFGNSPMYGAPYWAAYFLFIQWKNLDMRASLELIK